MGVRKFEGLIAWQKARELTKRIYALTADERFAKDYGLKDQIQRAAVSVMPNIAEGFEHSGLAEFHQFLVIAQGSCAKVRSQLYIAWDVGYISEHKFAELMGLVEEGSRLLGGLRSSVKNNIKT